FGSNTSTFLHHVSTDTYIHNSNLQGKSFIMTANGLQTKNHVTEAGEKGMQYAYSNFESIQLDGVPDVILFQSSSYTVYTEKGANYTPEFEMNGTRLRVYIDPFEAGNAIGQLYIGLPILNHLVVNGGSNVSVQFKQNKRLAVELNGASKIEGQFDGEEFDLESNGMNQAKLRGDIRQLRAEINGAGTCDFSKLEAKKVQLEANGSTHVQVQASESLEIDASGAAQVTYYGSPTNTRFEQSGGAKIIPASF
ncbi:MAG: DUF2807 domain-containing protein, partial [Bacteroidota bacterium]|nr:DUF2807 domain-containing protein [Bacteroidota bacterium]MDX5430038.1 DUF2807 domain-containing protein [Bacteroidota bacterium]MDX5468808.1 DUF2807 domain-containing protein [Bacteroidota bacterium]